LFVYIYRRYLIDARLLYIEFLCVYSPISVTRTIFPVFAFRVMHRVILLTRFCKLLTTVAKYCLGPRGGEEEAHASMTRRLCV